MHATVVSGVEVQDFLSRGGVSGAGSPQIFFHLYRAPVKTPWAGLLLFVARGNGELPLSFRVRRVSWARAGGRGKPWNARVITNAGDPDVRQITVASC